MSDELFPSGPWVGFYNYRPGDRHRMQLQLTFANGVMSGDGSDDVGRFLIKGRYDTGNAECHWTKSYIGAHDVFYQGFRQSKGIWGTWEITVHDHGGFHIWPKGMVGCDGDERTEASEKPEPVEAIGKEQAPRPGVAVEQGITRTLHTHYANSPQPYLKRHQVSPSPFRWGKGRGEGFPPCMLTA